MNVTLEPGTVFNGDFRVVKKLSQGGMGAVFVVEQESTGATRALKVMKPELVENPELRGRFELEAKVASRIPSEHVVQVVSAGVDAATGAPFLVMELLSGETLHDAVVSGGPFDAPRFLRTLRELCHALGAAHAAGIVHRDLKPENVFLARSLRAGGEPIVKVLDFGIAKILDAARTAETTAAIGTPTWMAPEQTDRAGKISPATDVWAVGLIGYFLLTGRSYWVGASSGSVAALFREILFDPIEPASVRARSHGVVVPGWFDAWFAGCVARDASGRFRDAALALAAVESALGVPHLEAPPEGPSVAPAPVVLTNQHPSEPVSGFERTHVPTVPAAPVRIEPPRAKRGALVAVVAVVASGVALLGVRLGIQAFTAPDRGCRDLSLSDCVYACERGGSARACFDLGEGHERGIGGFPKDAELARGAYRRACEDDHAEACGAFAELVVAKDRTDLSAMKPAEVACTAGVLRGCYARATLLMHSESVRDEVEAARVLEAACDKGHGPSCVARGDLASRRAEPSPARRRFYESACSSGFGLGCTRLAEGLLRGTDTPSDLAGARRRAIEGCMARSPRACAIEVALGLLALPADDPDAVRTLEGVCDDGDLVGCERLAFVLDRGWGATRNADRADALYARLQGDACSASDDTELVGACARAATRFGHGAVDKQFGERYLRQGCADGDPWGCLYAGDAAASDPKARQDFYALACKASPAAALDLTSQLACVEVKHRMGADSLAKGSLGEAEALFDAACEGGAGSGCLARADLLARELEPAAAQKGQCDHECRVAKVKKTWNLYFSACEAPSPALEACVRGADFAAERGHADAPYRLEKMRSACRRGHQPTCKVLDERKIAR